MVSTPIAVLDSGAGGLSVVSAIRRLMPDAELHYFADTAHLPYGIKSPELIKHLAIKMALRLKKLSACELMIVACHTISVWCLKEIEEAVGIKVIGMVQPTIMGLKEMLAQTPAATVGLLSTKATVQSNVYRNAWSAIDPNGCTKLVEHAAGPLVSLVEEADVSNDELTSILHHFLPQSLKSCDALVIGCTHFSCLVPLLKNALQKDCRIFDAADFVAREAKRYLDERTDYPASTSQRGLTIYVSDNKERFQNIARRFIEGELMIELIRDYART